MAVAACVLLLLAGGCTERFESTPAIILRWPFGEYDEQYHIDYDGRAIHYKSRNGHSDVQYRYTWIELDSFYALLAYADSIGFYKMPQGTRYQKEVDQKGRVIRETPMQYECSIRIEFRRPSFTAVPVYSDSPVELWSFVKRIQAVVDSSLKDN